MFGLDALQTYLLVINVVAFIVFTIDFFVYTHTGGEIMNHGLMCIFAVIGGPLGMLLAFLVWDRKVRKANVAWRFVAIAMLVVWAIILANVYGWLRFDAARLGESLARDHTPLLVYLAIINVATFVVFCVDKAKAVAGGYRIREFVLLGMSFAGGAVGGMLGMLIAHHKVNTYYFRYGLPIMLVIDVAVVAFLMQAGVV